MPSGDKRHPLDEVQSAIRAAKIATGEIDEQPERRIHLVVIPETQDVQDREKVLATLKAKRR